MSLNKYSTSLAILLAILLANLITAEEITLKSIDPKDIKMESVDLTGANKNRFNIGGIKDVIVKIHFRDKYLKKKGILDLAAEIEEGLAEEEIGY